MSDPEIRNSILRLGSWYTRHLQLEATCECGHVALVHRGALIRMLGNEGMVGEPAKRRIGQVVVCIRCGRRHPKLEIVVRPD